MIISPYSFEYYLFLTLTIILLIVKSVLALYLLKEVLKRKKKEGGKLQFDFMFSILVFMISLIISRIFFMIFDYGLTYFNSETYHQYPNYIFWKIAVIILTIGFAYIIFIADKKALNFKLKGIFAYYPLAIATLIAFWPINSPEDFLFISLLGIFSILSGIIIIFLYIYIGIKIEPLRRQSFLLTIGFILYALGTYLVDEFILEF